MTELELKQLLSKITRPDETARTAAHAHWASLAKPLGGLGRLETMLEDAETLLEMCAEDDDPALAEEADAVERAVDAVLAEGWRTPDIAAPGQEFIGTQEMGRRIREAL